MNILKYAINADQGTLHGQPLHVGVQNSLGHMWVDDSVDQEFQYQVLVTGFDYLDDPWIVDATYLGTFILGSHFVGHVVYQVVES